MFANGEELIKRLDNVLEAIEPATLTGVTDIQPVKLIICDINMPILDGYQTFVKIKELYS